jgi:hypothetical protein
LEPDEPGLVADCGDEDLLADAVAGAAADILGNTVDEEADGDPDG